MVNGLQLQSCWCVDIFLDDGFDIWATIDSIYTFGGSALSSLRSYVPSGLTDKGWAHNLMTAQRPVNRLWVQPFSFVCLIFYYFYRNLKLKSGSQSRVQFLMSEQCSQFPLFYPFFCPPSSTSVTHADKDSLEFPGVVTTGLRDTFRPIYMHFKPCPCSPNTRSLLVFAHWIGIACMYAYINQPVDLKIGPKSSTCRASDLL